MALTFKLANHVRLPKASNRYFATEELTLWVKDAGSNEPWQFIANLVSQTGGNNDVSSYNVLIAILNDGVAHLGGIYKLLPKGRQP